MMIMKKVVKLYFYNNAFIINCELLKFKNIDWLVD